MASGRIKGITIELDGDTTGLDKALKGVNKQTRNTQNELREVERALKFDPGNAELVAQQQQLLSEQIQNTSQKLDVLRNAQQQVQQQFERGEISGEQYRAFQREIIKTESQLGSFVDRLEESEQAAQQLGAGFEKVGESISQSGEKIKGIGESMTTGLTAPLAAFGTGALLSAAQFDNAAGQIQAALGITAEEAERLEDTAKNVWKAGFGESLDEVANGLIRVQQNMKEIDGSELESVTKNALALAKTFDSDVNEVTRAGNNLMVNFGISADEAFDMMAKGAQNGLNFSNELFDNLAEYSGLFANMGYSVEEYFGILQRGSEAGVYNLDYLNDVMKEFQIRIKDGSDAVGTAFGDMKQETQDVWDAFYYGEATVKDVASAVIQDLQSMEDQTYANFLGVSLFGTKWEDLEAKAMYAMLGVEGGLTDAKGAMDALSAAQEQTFGQRWESFSRTAAASLEPLGKILLDLAEEWLPKVIAVVEKVAKWFTDLSPIMQNVVVVVGAIVAAIGPFLAILGVVITTIGNAVTWFSKLSAAGPILGTAFRVLTGPIGLVVTAITAAIAIGTALYKNWDTIKAKAGELLGPISNTFENIKNAITTKINAAKDAVSKAINSIKSFFSNLKLKIPDIKLPKLPKFSISGKFSLDPPSVPKLNVSWNALGGIFTKPTVLQTNAGLQGFGEAGSEAIIPLKPDVLAGIGKGIAEQMNVGMPSTIVVQSVLDGRIVGETVTPFVSQNQQSNTSLKAYSRGVSL